jgi:two-component system, chemotaxis family, sensor kinase Cph1
MSATHFAAATIPQSKRFVIAVFDDITEKKRAELLLSENTAQILQQNKALEEFSYVISHDLQEPLRMITSFSQIIQRRYLAKMNNPDIDRDFNFVIDGAKRMSKLIKDMLEYSRWSSQHFPLEKVDTQEVISEVLQNLTISIGQANAEIIVGDFPNLIANRLVISQVFQNLIGNSINYRHPDRKSTIRVGFTYQPEAKNWLCSVRDNGRGFDEQQKERIFGIFQRLHTDKKGTGMGLAICKRIIEKQGGKIWAEGIPDEGATFLFTV